MQCIHASLTSDSGPLSGRARTQLAGAATSKDWVQDHLLLHLKTSNHLPIREAAPNAAEKLHNPPDIANPLITPFIARGLRVTLSLSGLGEGGESREVDALRQFDKQFSCARLQHPSSAAVSSHLPPHPPDRVHDLLPSAPCDQSKLRYDSSSSRQNSRTRTRTRKGLTILYHIAVRRC